MQPADPQNLINKYLEGKCTPEEKLMLERFYQHEAAKRELPPGGIDFEGRKTNAWNTIQKNIAKKAAPSGRVHIYDAILAAASVLLLISLSFWFYFGREKNEGMSAKTANKTTTISPGTATAVLTLADGSDISLDVSANGTLSKQAGAEVIKTANGSLAYKPGQKENSGNLSYNTLSVPKGGTYHLTLSDGSAVWLNSASSITFPVYFQGNERTVSIRGEAYFEVAKNKHKPFLVRSGDQTVQVLGTHFNVQAYDNGPSVTTLLEGSVKVLKKNSQTLLRPGQAASGNNNSDMITITDVNPADAIAWKQGYFKFNNENLESIMNKIARWYDLDINFRDDVKEKKFWGTYSRSKKLDDLLDNLEATGDVHFKIEGRRVTIMK